MKTPLVFAASAAAVGLIALPIFAQNPASGPIARYDMRAGTVAGMVTNQNTATPMTVQAMASRTSLRRIGSSFQRPL